MWNTPQNQREKWKHKHTFQQERLKTTEQIPIPWRVRGSTHFQALRAVRQRSDPVNSSVQNKHPPRVGSLPDAHLHVNSSWIWSSGWSVIITRIFAPSRWAWLFPVRIYDAPHQSVRNLQTVTYVFTSTSQLIYQVANHTNKTKTVFLCPQVRLKFFQGVRKEEN